MACSSCGHTMHGIGHGMFHCPRCGTLYADGSVAVPTLVGRCREFEVLVRPSKVLHADWHRLGIAEAIRPLGDPAA